MSRAIARPLKLLCTSPIVLLTSLYVGLVYAYTYLLFTSFPLMYEQIYGFDQSSVGLTYLGCGVGFSIGLVIFGTLSDRNAKKKAQAGDGEWKPEYRLPPLLPDLSLCPSVFSGTAGRQKRTYIGSCRSLAPASLPWETLQCSYQYRLISSMLSRYMRRVLQRPIL